MFSGAIFMLSTVAGLRMGWKPYGWQCLKYLLSGPLQEKFAKSALNYVLGCAV